MLPLKGNQGTLHQAVINYIDEQSQNDFADVQARRHRTQETGHGRQETRRSIQMPVPQELPGQQWWTGLKSIGMVESRCVRKGKETVEVRYYISSLGVGVKRFAHAVRSHWSIEGVSPIAAILHAKAPRKNKLSIFSLVGQPPSAVIICDIRGRLSHIQDHAYDKLINLFFRGAQHPFEAPRRRRRPAPGADRRQVSYPAQRAGSA